MPSQEPIHLFVYGTLTDPERVTALTGKQFEWVDATLSGFECVTSSLGYPFIRPKSGAVVQGILLLNIDPLSLVKLDAYEDEGDLYRRQSVVVERQRVAAHQEIERVRLVPQNFLLIHLGRGRQVGPLRLDVGFKLGGLLTFASTRESRAALHLSIGQAF